MHKVTILVVSIFILTGCVSLEQQKSNVKSDIYEVYSNLYEAEILEFFVDEAVEAGVRKIRKMKPSDVLETTNENEMVGCAYGFKNSKTILIEVDQPRCVTLATLAHEISHIGSNCNAHNDIFYKYNFAVAKRYEEKFPNASKRKWFAPVQDVANVAAIYRSEGC